VGIFELLVMDDSVRDAVTRRVPHAELRERALAAGMLPLRADAWEKAAQGLTTVEEVLRVLQD
jgi:general secretion pathway protein E